MWRAKLKSCKRAIRQIKNHSSTIDQVTREGIIKENTLVANTKKNEVDADGDDQQSQLPSMESFVPSMRTIIEARLANMEQRAQQIMKFINASFQ